VIGPSTDAVAAPARARTLSAALATGAGVGLLGGLIGLGGAEFRLPLLIGLFGFAALQAVIMNKAMSLIVVVTALPARLVAVPFDTVSGYWYVVVNMLAGSLIGAWMGATWATRVRSATLYRVLAVLLALIAIGLAWNHFGDLNPLVLDPVPRTLLGLAAGVGIGIVAALMGVAGGELLIPTIVLLFAVDIKIAGSLALAISLPTMLVAFARYSRDRSFEVLRANRGLCSPWRPDRSSVPSSEVLSLVSSPKAPDPSAGCSSPRVFGQGLATRLTIKSLSLRVARCRRAGASGARRAESRIGEADDPRRDVI